MDYFPGPGGSDYSLDTMQAHVNQLRAAVGSNIYFTELGSKAEAGDGAPPVSSATQKSAIQSVIERFGGTVNGYWIWNKLTKKTKQDRFSIRGPARKYLEDTF